MRYEIFVGSLGNFPYFDDLTSLAHVAINSNNFNNENLSHENETV